jgi:tetratricopeptide (TPR) repeat protein/TolB-like protein
MSEREVLQSWKEISAYLRRDIRTCCRWEAKLGLPIHRLNGSPKARVMAYKDELDRWLDMKLHEREVVAPSVRPLLKRWPVIALFLGLLVVGVLGWRSISNGRPHYIPNGGPPTLAVLPFVNGTGDDSLNYLLESVPDHLIRNLQRDADHMTVYSFNVVADTVRKLGVEPGKPLTPNDLAAVASRTGAGWLLVGYLNKSGTKFRIDYELCEAKSLDALKTGHVPGTEAEVPVMEGRVADSVRDVFGIPTAAHPKDLLPCTVQATPFYETARAIERKYTLSQSPAELARMIDLFDEARRADPGCPLAYLGLGDAYQFRYVYEGKSPDALKLMNENYERAYEMARERAETNVGMAWVYFFRRDNDQSYAYLKKAMELDPTSLHVLTDVGAFLASIGVLERSTEYFSRVIRAGGGSADMYFLRAWSYEQMGFYESALADFDKMVELEPTDCRTRCRRARVLILMKRFDEAAAELAMAETLAPGDTYTGIVRALAAAAKGEKKAALAAIAPARASGRPVLYTYYLSRVYAALGLKNEALDNMELAIDQGFDDVQTFVYFFPFLNNTRDYFYDKVRSEPRFRELLRREELKYAERLQKYSGL